MENIFNTEGIENLGENLEKKFSGLTSNTYLCAAAGSLLLAATLKLAGKKQAGSFFSKWTIPLLAIGCYKKYSDASILKTNADENKDDKETLADDSIAST